MNDARPITERCIDSENESKTMAGPKVAGGARHWTVEEDCTVAAVVPMPGNLMDPHETSQQEESAYGCAVSLGKLSSRAPEGVTSHEVHAMNLEQSAARRGAKSRMNARDSGPTMAKGAHRAQHRLVGRGKKWRHLR